MPRVETSKKKRQRMLAVVRVRPFTTPKEPRETDAKRTAKAAIANQLPSIETMMLLAGCGTPSIKDNTAKTVDDRTTADANHVRFLGGAILVIRSGKFFREGPISL
jgi:hypothetical protein